jgi:hypothetical protein
VKIKRNVKACRIALNHNQMAAHALKVKTNVKAGVEESGDRGGSQLQHNQKVARGLNVKTGIKAGPPGTPIIRD